jgi:hypothetical protein
MPKTFLVENKAWKSTGTEEYPTGADGPYFVKECNKNGGKAVLVARTLDDALALVENTSTFVVQQHVPNPLLTTSGCKCHIKAYFLLTEDAGQWQLRMYPEAFLSVSPNRWTPTDLSMETQITVKRTRRLFKGEECTIWPSGWPSSYEKVRDLVRQVVDRAVQIGKLQSRGSVKRQFEIFSADVMIDEQYRPWLIECNFGCVLFDPKIGQPLTTTGLKRYQELYESQGEAAEVNDHNMLADTVSLIFDQESESSTCVKWELIGQYRSTPTEVAL